MFWNWFKGRSTRGFMDKVDYTEELGNAMDGNRIFPSIEALREAKPCTEQCGIVEVRVSLVRVIQESDYWP